MFRGIKIALVLMLAVVMLGGCGKSDKKTTPTTNPASGSGTTNASGTASFTVGSYTVNATVRDTTNAGLPNINLTGRLLHSGILITAFDPTSVHYPVITIQALSALARVEAPDNADRLISPQSGADAAVNVAFTMYATTLDVFGYSTEPYGLDSVVSDSWTTETCNSGLLSNIHSQIIADTADYSRGVFIHLSQGVAQALGSPVRTAVFMPNGFTDFPTFSSLIGIMFRIFSADTVHYCKLSYSNTGLPFMSIDGITQERGNFWAQFTLTWGRNPRDLDSHLWTPTINGVNFHIYYGNAGDSASAPNAELDVDDVTSFGPEHMTIFTSYTGTYTYAIHHYCYWDDDSLNIARSQAVVTLLKSNGQVQIFNVPTDTTGVGTCWYWYVCDIDGATGNVTVVNRLQATAPRTIMEAEPPLKTEWSR